MKGYEMSLMFDKKIFAGAGFRVCRSASHISADWFFGNNRFGQLFEFLLASTNQFNDV
jgi:hypothetical protein